jgi:hypothetical protein
LLIVVAIMFFIEMAGMFSSSENRYELGEGKEARSGSLGICPRVYCVCLR